MAYSDWRKYFNNLFACVDFPDTWSGIRFFGQWTAENSGGVPTDQSPEMIRRWARNPQFIVNFTRPTELFIALAQEDGRFVEGMSYPFEGKTKTACFALMRLDHGEMECPALTEDRVV
jgi:calpain